MLCQLRHVNEVLIEVLDQFEPTANAYTQIVVHAAPSAIGLNETPS